MSGLSKRLEWFYHFLASKQLALGLLVVLCLILVPGTFMKTTEIRVGLVPRAVFGLTALNLVLCTLQRIRTLSKPVLILHLGIILTLGGAVVSSFGYIATVNIHEGTSVNTVYRWDVKEDRPLGIDLAVRKINVEHYPIPVKVGVLRGEEKFGLFVLKTGESFPLAPYTIRVDALEFPSENLRLSVFQGESLIGSADTSGERDLPLDFPYDFRLVAYKNPSPKRVWVDLTLSKDSEVIAEGTSEVNRPLTWKRMSFYNVKIDRDDHGLPFAGIQITNDPGKPFVYFGFAVIGTGSVLYFLRRLAKVGK